MPDSSIPVAETALPTIPGLQAATVTQLATDPQALYPVQVQVAAGAAAVWARYMHSYGAGGAAILPEVGDEVLISFVEGASRYPVILGLLNGSRNRPPDVGAIQNSKPVATQGGAAIQAGDGNRTFTIRTAGGNSILISDETQSISIQDQNGNSVCLSNTGMELTSSKDITIKAAGNISLEAAEKILLSAKQDLTGTGLNVSLTADVGITAKGNAMAEFSAAGQTTLKGGVVMIN